MLILLGVAAGTLFLNLILGFHGTALTERIENFHRILESQLEPSAGLFFRICFYRLGTAAVIFYCVRFMKNYYVFYPVIFLMSLSFGYTLALLSYRYGAVGLIYLFAYLCPQYFIYLPLFAAILRETSDRMDQMFSPNLRRTLLIFGALLIGCVTESYLNPVFLRFVLKNFL